MARGKSKPLASASLDRSRPAIGWLNVILAAVIGAAAMFALTPSRPESKPLVQASAPVARFSITNLLDVSDDALAKSDIAELNLQSAAGLPGSENLDIDATLRTLDEWARRVKFDTDRHLYQFRENPAEYENSEPYYRMLMMTTVIQQDLGVRYNPERARNPDFKNSNDLFIHGLLGDRRSGTCASMPVLSIAIGRRLGYPLKLAQARSHLYVRWELGGDDGKHLNFEATSLGLLMYDDEFYATWPEPLSDIELKSGAFLRALTPREELAVFFNMRGHCLHDNGRLAEAQVAYALAHQMFPSYPFTLPFLATAVQGELGRSPMFARSRIPSPPPRQTADEMLRYADEINAMNAANLARMRGEGTQPPTPQPGTNPYGGSP